MRSCGATKSFQNHVSSQVSHLAIGVNCSHYVDELLAFEHRALVTHVQGALPKFMLSTPKMKRARESACTNCSTRCIPRTHPPRGKASRLTLPTQYSNCIDNDPQFLPETDITFPFVASMVASIYLGSALTFAVYSMIRHPDLYERVHREAEALFGNGHEPGVEDFSFDNVGVAQRLFMESERLHPVIPWQLRTVMNQCIINGFEIPPQTWTLICQTVSHYTDTAFKDPLKFDIDRYLPEREEHLAPGRLRALRPRHPHLPGRRWVELQMTVNLLLIAYHLQLEILPANYRLGINPFPTSAPNSKLKFRVARITNPV